MKKAKVLKDRFELIKNYVKDKDVLDLGCVAHNTEFEKDEFWLHKYIKKYAKTLTGVDLDEKGVKVLNKRGYNIIVDNVETYNLKKKFDVIVAGETIEHVRNVGLFLDATRNHMDKHSRFIITTPNAPALRFLLRSLILGKNNKNIYNHTAWFDYETLIQCFDYADLEVDEWFYFFPDNKPRYKYYFERFFTLFRPILTPNILFVLKKK